LRRVDLELSDAEALGALERRLAEVGVDNASEDSASGQESGGRLALRDPDGHALVFSDASARV
jgi:hypothetical protein